MITPIDYIDSLEAKSEWNEYISSGLMKDIGSFHRCLMFNSLNKSGLATFFLENDSFSKDDLTHMYDKHIVSNLIDYLVITDILVKHSSNDLYSLSENGRRCLSAVSLAQIGFYVEAYAPVLFEMSELITQKKQYGKDVLRDGAALGEHCAHLFTVFHAEIILTIIKEKDLKSILDLGCGGGAMLVDACKSDLSLQGYGIDIAPGAIDFAKQLCIEEKLQDRLKFDVGDAFIPETWPDYGSIDAISAVGTLHEHFREGEKAVIKMLNVFASLIRDRRAKFFILGEPELYYDNGENDPDLFLVHIFTAQGFPRRREQWMEIIDRSELKCEKVYTRKGIGPRFCFYLLGLR